MSARTVPLLHSPWEDMHRAEKQGGYDPVGSEQQPPGTAMSVLVSPILLPAIFSQASLPLNTSRPRSPPLPLPIPVPRVAYELKMRECCRSCRAARISPSGHVVAGPRSASSAHAHSPAPSHSPSPSRALAKPVSGADTAVLCIAFPIVRRKGCASSCVDRYGPTMLSRTALDRSERACVKR